MSKGAVTRQAILDHAVGVATVVGLEGLSIGKLAEELHLSKSGLFAHFQSKEALQIQVIDAASARFIDRVVRPGLAAPRGSARLRALFDGWIAWGKASANPGGCFFAHAAFELSGLDGPVRDRLAETQQDWMDTLAQAARSGVSTGEFRADIDPDQFAFDVYGLILGFHHAHRLLRDPRAEVHARAAFERLLHHLRS